MTASPTAAKHLSQPPGELRELDSISLVGKKTKGLYNLGKVTSS